MNAAHRELIHAQADVWKLERLAREARNLGHPQLARDLERGAIQARHIVTRLRWIVREELAA